MEYPEQLYLTSDQKFFMAGTIFLEDVSRALPEHLDIKGLITISAGTSASEQEADGTAASLRAFCVAAESCLVLVQEKIV